MRKPRKARQSRRHKVSNRSTRNKDRAPQKAEELFASSRRFQDQWRRIVQVPSEMRSKGLTLRQAAKHFGVSPETVIRLAGSVFRKNKNGRFEAKPSDRLLRVLLIPSTKGLREVAVRDSREASLIGEYWSAVEKYLARGDASALKKLPRKNVTDAKGKRVRLLTDLDELKRQASAGVLHFESLYGRNA